MKSKEKFLGWKKVYIYCCCCWCYGFIGGKFKCRKFDLKSSVLFKDFSMDCSFFSCIVSIKILCYIRTGNKVYSYSDHLRVLLFENYNVNFIKILNYFVWFLQEVAINFKGWFRYYVRRKILILIILVPPPTFCKINLFWKSKNWIRSVTNFRQSW